MFKGVSININTLFDEKNVHGVRIEQISSIFNEHANNVLIFGPFNCIRAQYQGNFGS